MIQGFSNKYLDLQCREVLESLKDKGSSKKKEVSAEIQLQEVTANIDLMDQLKNGGLTVDAELARLKEMEGDCEDLVASAAVPDWSISELDLPQSLRIRWIKSGVKALPWEHRSQDSRILKQVSGPAGLFAKQALMVVATKSCSNLLPMKELQDGRHGFRPSIERRVDINIGRHRTSNIDRRHPAGSRGLQSLFKLTRSQKEIMNGNCLCKTT
ncbi:hypothetical protein F2Q69_00043019 [Brassica cretica]|uniref:Uncharacterized protein n=1 Tax=Brassica cretica TaxID=69181 RepID=A0A8S9NIC1_BRACR|nr:hypothetical protein F2Q69_00043019 [Brassica cretica]